MKYTTYTTTGLLTIIVNYLRIIN